ncbi:MAG TPA: metallophosphoesterase [Firmicutes bacterium]|nr:metallophosphoesterase [Bacillota bacterium]
MVYVTGDMHGEDARWYDRQLRRLKKGDTLLICGDFGYVWNGSKREKKDLEYLGSRPYAIGFLDGTHENFDLLNSYRQTVWNGGRVHRISGTLFHLIRGQIFTIEGQRYFVFGGGESPDKEIRLEQHSWWREELPSPAEMAEGAENLDEVDCKVDYILTHEPPSLVKSAILLRSGRTDRVSKLNGYLEEVDRSCTFRHWYFGSIHEDRTVTPRHTALFRKIIPVGEDFTDTEDNNFLRSMFAGRRAAVRKAAQPQTARPAAPEEPAEDTAPAKPAGSFAAQVKKEIAEGTLPTEIPADETGGTGGQGVPQNGAEKPAAAQPAGEDAPAAGGGQNTADAEAEKAAGSGDGPAPKPEADVPAEHKGDVPAGGEAENTPGEENASTAALKAQDGRAAEADAPANPPQVQAAGHTPASDMHTPENGREKAPSGAGAEDAPAGTEGQPVVWETLDDIADVAPAPDTDTPAPTPSSQEDQA